METERQRKFKELIKFFENALIDAIDKGDEQELFKLVKRRKFPITTTVLRKLYNSEYRYLIADLLKITDWDPQFVDVKELYHQLLAYWGVERAAHFVCQYCPDVLADWGVLIDYDILVEYKYWTVLADRKVYSRLAEHEQFDLLFLINAPAKYYASSKGLRFLMRKKQTATLLGLSAYPNAEIASEAVSCFTCLYQKENYFSGKEIETLPENFVKGVEQAIRSWYNSETNVWSEDVLAILAEADMIDVLQLINQYDFLLSRGLAKKINFDLMRRMPDIAGRCAVYAKLAHCGEWKVLQQQRKDLWDCGLYGLWLKTFFH